jgi:hypothetical protein
MFCVSQVRKCSTEPNVPVPVCAQRVVYEAVMGYPQFPATCTETVDCDCPRRIWNSYRVTEVVITRTVACKRFAILRPTASMTSAQVCAPTTSQNKEPCCPLESQLLGGLIQFCGVGAQVCSQGHLQLPIDARIPSWS